METSPRSTDIILGMKCPACSSSLSLLAGRSQLTFHCKGGHSYPLRQLFQTYSQDVNRGLRAVLAIWEEKAALLARVVDQARGDGRPELAATFHHEAAQVAVRIRCLRDHLNSVSDGLGNGSSAAG